MRLGAQLALWQLASLGSAFLLYHYCYNFIEFSQINPLSLLSLICKFALLESRIEFRLCLRLPLFVCVFASMSVICSLISFRTCCQFPVTLRLLSGMVFPQCAGTRKVANFVEDFVSERHN